MTDGYFEHAGLWPSSLSTSIDARSEMGISTEAMEIKPQNAQL